ncbi:MAG: dihydrodipicolinate synthase family protein, partial [Burkholderiales bacterium]|nr:dihydrodipicolinate synthase family protein [Burkholderiales bacterium]
MKRDTLLTIKLPVAGGTEEFPIHEPGKFDRPGRSFTRKALAAAHVVADPLSTKEPWLEAAIDWDATLAYRRHLWSWGFGVAEAMDTAQRGMGLDWANSLELIRRSVAEATQVPGAFVASGAGTDHLSPHKSYSVQEIVAAYESQCAAIEKLGGRIILMASRALAAAAKSPDDYARVYERILSQVREPVIIHWLGEMFDPALEGY